MLNNIKRILGKLSRTSDTSTVSSFLESPACPYCGIVQDPPPKRKKKCRDCGLAIYVKKRPDGQKYLTTEREAKRLDQEQRDAKWSELNRQAIDSSTTGDWHAVKMAHFQQALMLFQEGRDHHQLAQESRKAELRHYLGVREMGLGSGKVKISTAREASCPTCRPLQGKVFGIEEALAEMPIPVRECQFRKDKKPHGGWCRCLYLPVLDDDL